MEQMKDVVVLSKEKYEALKREAEAGKSKTGMTTSNKVLVVLAVLTVVFIAVMVAVFCAFQTVPDTLIAGVFALIGGECGVLGWIKTTKEKRQERAWQQQDRKQEREELALAAQNQPAQSPDDV